jgi:DNA-binding GntR family transcriptional regulator
LTTSSLLLRSVLADQVRDHLLESILSGRFPPNSRIIETQVARDLGTSQTPVREALRGLEAIGVVEITPFRGARVRRPSRDELLEAYVVRSGLETMAARLAMARLTDADLAELEGYGAEMDDAALAGDTHRVAEADARFHGRIVEIAGNRTLDKAWRSLEPFSRTYITLMVPGADPHWSVELHTPIIEALKRRDVEAVVEALQRHFIEASANMARRWPDDEPGAPGSTGIGPAPGR